MPGTAAKASTLQRYASKDRMPSSVIAAMHYHEETRVLTLVYRGQRGRYRYFDVPPDVWTAFQAAPSKGTYLNETFKARNFRYEKVRDRAA